jgi:predicted SAM-dependent methyltransferase
MREELSSKYLSGNGIEIGALCHPLKVNGAVTYVDRFDKSGLNNQYQDIPTDIMNRVDVIDDGEELASFESNSQNFVIANHFLEHCKNPIKAVENWLRILKPSGKIFCAVPNKEKSFDIDRDVTTFEHLLEEYETGETNDIQHYFDATDDADEAKRLMDMKYSIHYHVWDKKAMDEFFNKSAKILPVAVIDYGYNDEREEFIFILEKV